MHARRSQAISYTLVGVDNITINERIRLFATVTAIHYLPKRKPFVGYPVLCKKGVGMNAPSGLNDYQQIGFPPK